jgi:pimeloyl-ACP methyl ester carboxylesterase
VLTLDDGHRVGVTIGGNGVPLVFLHGIALNTRVYTRFLSRLTVHGFRVIAIDAAAHGQTAPLLGADFRSNVDLVARTMDALGVRKAILVGHSMGGRATIELAAGEPERVVAAVLLDAAGGDAFDITARKALQSRPAFAVGIFGALYDTTVDWWHCRNWRERRLYGMSLASALASWGGRPHLLTAAMHAVAGSTSTRELLRRARNNEVPIIVVHGEKDILVPWRNAVAMAQHAGANLHKVPRAYHSWMIADPGRGAETLGRIMHTELADVLQAARGSDPAAGGADAFLAPGALAVSLGLSAHTG